MTRVRRLSALVAATTSMVVLGATAASAAVGDPSSYRFLATSAEGAPARWNPCEPIPYRVNLKSARPTDLEDTREALRRITAVSGLQFRETGTTDFIPQEGNVKELRDLVIAFVDAADTDLSGDSGADGQGGPVMRTGYLTNGSRVPWIVGGFAAIYTSGDLWKPSGFDHFGSQGALLLHEVAHAIGLDHADDSYQTMHALRNRHQSPGEFGAGDINGLRRVGAGSNPCIGETAAAAAGQRQNGLAQYPEQTTGEYPAGYPAGCGAESTPCQISPSPSPSPTAAATPAGPSPEPSASPQTTATPTTPGPTPSQQVSPSPTHPQPTPSETAPAVATPRLFLSHTPVRAGATVVATIVGTPNTTVYLNAKVQPATTFRRIRVLTTDAYGQVRTTLYPNANMRLTPEAPAAGRPVGGDKLLEVASVTSLTPRRIARGSYEFAGRSAPRRAGAHVVLRLNGTFVNLATDANGIYRYRRTFRTGQRVEAFAQTVKSGYALGSYSPRRVFTVT